MKIKRNVGLVFFLIIGSFLFSCKTNRVVEKPVIKEVNYIPYYLKVYEADSLYLIDNFEGSYKILDSLFKVYPPLNSDNYVEYGTYLNSAVMSNHLQNIDEKVKFGYLHFGNIQSLHKRGYQMYKAVNKAANLSDDSIKSLKTKYYTNLNLELRKKMIEMYNADQGIRENYTTYTKEIIAVDENNRIELNKIFKIYGFPIKSLIGSNNAYDVPDKGRIGLDVLFMHQTDSVKSKYLPILLEGVKKRIL